MINIKHCELMFIQDSLTCRLIFRNQMIIVLLLQVAIPNDSEREESASHPTLILLVNMRCRKLKGIIESIHLIFRNDELWGLNSLTYAFCSTSLLGVNQVDGSPHALHWDDLIVHNI